MRYIVEHNFVQVIGTAWYPYRAATEYPIDRYALDNILGYAEFLHGGERKLTREAIAHWLSLNSGDFSGIDDFRASIGDEEFPWADEESEFTYNDCVYGDEEADYYPA